MGEKSTPQDDDRTKIKRDKSRQVLNFVKDIPHTVVTFFNPAWNDKSEEDCWYGILPMEGLPAVVKTPFKGYTPQYALKDLAMAMLANPTGVEENSIQEYPEINDPSTLKLISMIVPIYRMK
jgi:hypothetical protein